MEFQDSTEEVAKPFSEDFLLGGRVFIKQPHEGYRVAIDPILLAASIQPHSGETILDVGAGVGAASLCLATRCLEAKIIALEINRDFVRLATDNIASNQLRHRIDVVQGDLIKPPPKLAAGTFSHVMTNPPFIPAHRGRPSPFENKLTSNHDVLASLENWVKFCLLMVKPKGCVTFIYRADQLDKLLFYTEGKLGDITIFPLFSHQGKPAKRVLVRGVKNSAGSLTLLPGMVLHQEDGAFTKEAEGILRYAHPLVF